MRTSATVSAALWRKSSRSPATDPRRRWRRFLVAAGVVAVAMVGLASWSTWTSLAIGSVTVTWADPPICTGTDQRDNPLTIVVRRDMSCVIAVTVRNGSRATIQLDHAVLPFLGPRDGQAVKAAPVDGRTPENGPYGNDAVMPLDHALSPGESWTFRTRVTFRPRGCTPGTFRVNNWPAVQVAYLGREGLVHGDDDFIIHSPKQNPGCRVN